MSEAESPRSNPARRATDERLVRHDVSDYACHERARTAYHGDRASTRGGRRRRGVLRRRDHEDHALPTRDEIRFVQAIAGYLAFSLPSGFDRELWFVRSFLHVFHYGGGAADTPKREAKRRRALARDLVARGESVSLLKTKLQLASAEAEIMFDYALQRTAHRWHVQTEENAYDEDLEDEANRIQRPEEPDVERDDDESEPSALDEIMTRIVAAPAAPGD